MRYTQWHTTALCSPTRSASVQLNYTTVLNIVFLVLAVVLVVRFFRTGGRQMMAMMNAPVGGPATDHEADDVRQE